MFKILLRKNEKIKELQSKLEYIEERDTSEDFILIQKLKMKISELRWDTGYTAMCDREEQANDKINSLTKQLKIETDKVAALEYEVNFCKMNEEESKQKEETAVTELNSFMNEFLHLKKCMPEPQPLQEVVQYSCNGCSTRVSFTTETSATKLHLCHGCFVKTGAWVQ